VTRKQANDELLKELSQLLESNPDLRFGQTLNNFGFVRQVRPANPNLGLDWKNEFYTESTEVLERVKRCVKNMGDRNGT
jgi:hypothetical protein